MQNNDKNKIKIGFIGQGWIGKSYADDFENRGYQVLRYALEEPYNKNKEKIKTCDITFMAVPTPTTPKGFDDSIVRKLVKLIAPGKTVVIKSTILPGTTQSIQAENPEIFIMHSPEFLIAASAEYDAANPKRNIIGIPKDSDEFKEKASAVMQVLPRAPFESICQVKEAELIKYFGNFFLYLKVIYANIIYDLTDKLDCDWDIVRDSVSADPRIGKSHLDPVHDSGRGAGGFCFIKDFSALYKFYQKNVSEDKAGINFLKSIEEKNINLLLNSKKDLDLLKGVYGDIK